jgi:hypothetical protein
MAIFESQNCQHYVCHRLASGGGEKTIEMMQETLAHSSILGLRWKGEREKGMLTAVNESAAIFRIG